MELERFPPSVWGSFRLVRETRDSPINFQFHPVPDLTESLGKFGSAILGRSIPQQPQPAPESKMIPPVLVAVKPTTSNKNTYQQLHLLRILLSSLPLVTHYCSYWKPSNPETENQKNQKKNNTKHLQGLNKQSPPYSAE